MQPKRLVQIGTLACAYQLSPDEIDVLIKQIGAIFKLDWLPGIDEHEIEHLKQFEFPEKYTDIRFFIHKIKLLSDSEEPKYVVEQFKYFVDESGSSLDYNRMIDSLYFLLSKRKDFHDISILNSLYKQENRIIDAYPSDYIGDEEIYAHELTNEFGMIGIDPYAPFERNLLNIYMRIKDQCEFILFNAIRDISYIHKDRAIVYLYDKNKYIVNEYREITYDYVSNIINKYSQRWAQNDSTFSESDIPDEIVQKYEAYLSCLDENTSVYRNLRAYLLAAQWFSDDDICNITGYKKSSLGKHIKRGGDIAIGEAQLPSVRKFFPPSRQASEAP